MKPTAIPQKPTVIRGKKGIFTPERNISEQQRSGDLDFWQRASGRGSYRTKI